MKAIVHIGLNKTGTKTIQRFLTRNAAALEARGVTYDATLCPDWSDSQLDLAVLAFARAGQCLPQPLPRIRGKLPDLAAHKARADAFDTQLRDTVAKVATPTMVLSSEHVGRMVSTTAVAQQLDDWLTDIFDDVTYVMYIRAQSDWLLSRYSDHLRIGGTNDLGTFLRDEAAYDFNPHIAPWANVAGDRFVLRLLEDDWLTNGDLLNDFCAVIGTKPDSLARLSRQNEAFGVAAAHLLRHLNAQSALMNEGETALNPLYKGLHSTLIKLEQPARKLALSADQIAMVEAATAETNEAIREAHFPERETLFAPRIAPDHVDNTPTLDELTQICVALTVALRSKRIPPLTPDETDQLRQLIEADAEPVVQFAGSRR